MKYLVVIMKFNTIKQIEIFIFYKIIFFKISKIICFHTYFKAFLNIIIDYFYQIKFIPSPQF